MSVAPRIIVKMTADISQLKKSMADAKQSVNEASKSIKKTMTGINASLNSNKKAWADLAQSTRAKTTDIGKSANNIGKAIDGQSQKVAKASASMSKSLSQIGIGAQKASMSVSDSARTVQSTMNTKQNAVKQGVNGMLAPMKALKSFMALKFVKGMAQAAEQVRADNLAFANVFGSTADYAEMRMNNLAGEIGKLPGRLKPTFTLMNMVWTGMGKSASEAMALVEKQTMLAADAAGFFGLGVEEANRAMASWIKGNTGAGFALGLTAHQADIGAWAARELGIAWADLDNEGRKLVRMQFAHAFYENAGVLGFASENSVNLADAWGNLNHAWMQLQAIMGATFLEAKVSAIQSVTDGVMWLVNGLNEGEGAWRLFQGALTAVQRTLTTVGNNFGLFLGILTATQLKMRLSQVFTKNLGNAIGGLSVDTKISASAFRQWKTNMVGANTVTKKTAITMKALRGGMVATTKAVKAKAVAVKSLKAIKTFGLSFAITALIGGLVNLRNRLGDCTIAYDELRETTDRLVNNSGQLQQSLNNSTGQFNEQRDAVRKLNEANLNYLNRIQNLAESDNRAAGARHYLYRMTNNLAGAIGATKELFDEEGSIIQENVRYFEDRIELMRLQGTVNTYQERSNELLDEESRILDGLADIHGQRFAINRAVAEGALTQEQANRQLRELDEIYGDLNSSLAENREQLYGVNATLEASRQAMLEKSLALGDYQISLLSMSETQLEVFERMKDQYRAFADVASNRTSLVVDTQEMLVQRTNAQGKAIEGSYYSLETSLRKTLNNKMDIWEENIKATERWGEHIRKIAERDFGEMSQSAIDQMVRMAEECPEWAMKMVNASDEQWSRMKGLVERESEAATNAMNNMFGDGYDELINLTTYAVGSELPQALQTAVDGADFPNIGRQIPEELSEGIEKGSYEAKEASEAMAEKVIEGAKEALDMASPSGVFIEIGENVPKSMAMGIEQAKGELSEALKALVPIFKQTGIDVIEALDLGISTTKAKVITTIDTMLHEVKTSVDNASESLNNAFDTLGNNLNNSVDAMSNEIINSFSTMKHEISESLNELPEIGRLALNRMNTQMRNGMNEINTTARNNNTTLNNTMRTLEGSFRTSGANAMRGLNQGLLNGRGTVMNTANRIANDVRRTMQNALRISSPSRVMADSVGEPIVDGLVLGISTNADKVREEMLELAEIVTGTMDGTNNVHVPNFDTNDSYLDSRREELDLLRQQVYILTQILNRGTKIQIDGRELAEVTHDYFDSIGGQVTRLEERWT